jgi:hypothetical protein
MSELLESIPHPKVILEGRERLLVQVMLAAFMSTREEGTDFVFGTDHFLEVLQDYGFHVEAADHQLLISEVQ